MNIYEMTIAADNPLFEGLVLTKRTEILDTWPSDWDIKHHTWLPRSMKATWPTLEVEGNVRRFNDYPCINLSRPAFSQRAVDLMRDILEPNGELLPVKHPLGTYYFYNCTCMSNCIDLVKSSTKTFPDGGIILNTNKMVFVDFMLDGLTIFKVRTLLLEVFCTQTFVNRVESVGLQGFVFIPVWPLPEGITYNDEMYRIGKLSDQWKPKNIPELDVKGNSIVVRLYCERKKASKKELAAVEDVMTHLEKSLYDASQSSAEEYFGNVEGDDVVDHELRVFISTPDCDRLVAHLMPSLRSLPWPGKYHVVKRRGEYVDGDAMEEYLPLG